MQRLYIRKVDGKGWVSIGYICDHQHIRLDTPSASAAVVNQPKLWGVDVG